MHNGYKLTVMGYCVKSAINSRCILFLFRADRSTKHLVDWMSAHHNSFHKLRSGKSDKYGFSRLPV